MWGVLTSQKRYIQSSQSNCKSMTSIVTLGTLRILYIITTVSVRVCVRPTRQFRVLMDRRNRPGRSDSENGRPDRAGRGRGAGGRAGPGRGAGQGHPRARAGKNGVLENGVRENGRPDRAGRGRGQVSGQVGAGGRGQGKAGRAGAK
jgi:hypothetical protein